MPAKTEPPNLPSDNIQNIHIGCGHLHIAGFLNADCIATGAADVVCDCSDLTQFGADKFSIIYNNAFLEHLYHSQVLPFLKSAELTLKTGGVLFCSGIPNFREVARAYIAKEHGLLSSVFDMEHVLRFTHGGDREVLIDPLNWGQAELHKNLFDSEVLAGLCKNINMNSIIFTYCWGKEHLPVSMALISMKLPMPSDIGSWVTKFTAQFPSNINPYSINIEEVVTNYIVT